MTSSNGTIFRVTGPLCGEFTGPGEFPAQRPVTRSFDVFFDLRLNKRLRKQQRRWWFETPPWLSWRHCNVYCDIWWLITEGRQGICRQNLCDALLSVSVLSSTGLYHSIEFCKALQWQHTECDGVLNHQPYECVLNSLFERKQRNHQSSASLAFGWGIHRRPGNIPRTNGQ